MVVGQGMGLPSATTFGWEAGAGLPGFLGIVGQGIGLPSATNLGELIAIEQGVPSLMGGFGHGIGLPPASAGIANIASSAPSTQRRTTVCFTDLLLFVAVWI